MDVFNGCYWIKEVNSLRKEINRLLSKGMSNICLKVTITEKKWRTQNFDFLSLKKLSPGGAPTHADIIEF